MAVCADMAGLWAASGWIGALAGVLAAVKADEDVLPQSLANCVRSVV